MKACAVLPVCQLRVDGIEILVMTIAQQMLDLQQFKAFGITPLPYAKWRFDVNLRHRRNRRRGQISAHDSFGRDTFGRIQYAFASSTRTSICMTR